MSLPTLVQRSYSGGALPSTLTAGMGVTDSTFTILNGVSWLTLNPATGQPYGTNIPLGTNGTLSNLPFVISVDYNTANEEKILCTGFNQSTNTVTVYTGTSGYDGRGYDGTTALAHASGATCVPVLSATEVNEANEATVATIGAVLNAGDLLIGAGAKSLQRLGYGAIGSVLTSTGSSPYIAWQPFPGSVYSQASSSVPTSTAVGQFWYQTDTGVLLIATGVGSTYWTNVNTPQMTRVNSSGSITLANSTTTPQRVTGLVTSTGFPYPTSGFFTIPGSNDRVTVSVAGIYEVVANVTLSAWANAANVFNLVQTHSGTNTTVSSVSGPFNQLVNGTANITDHVTLAAGDQIGMTVLNNASGGGSTNVINSGTFMTVRYVAP